MRDIRTFFFPLFIVKVPPWRWAPLPSGSTSTWWPMFTTPLRVNRKLTWPGWPWPARESSSQVTPPEKPFDFGSFKIEILSPFFNSEMFSFTPERGDYWFWPAGFALGWGPIPWLVMSEVFPVKVRGFASAVCVLTNWSMAFLITKTFQNMMVSHRKNLKVLSKQDFVSSRKKLWHPMCTLQESLTSAGTFWLFSSMCFINVVFTIVFVPETKGKTLEQIEATFRGTSGP